MTTLAGHLQKQHNISASKRITDPGQMVFDCFGQVALPDILPDNQKANIFKALVDWLVDDKQAFRVVENAKFLRFVNSLNNLFFVPSRRTVVRGIADG
jgi:hypothetical protein